MLNRMLATLSAAWFGAGIRVRGVDQELELHDNQEGVSALQGGRSRRRDGASSEWRPNWPPAARFFVGAAGGVLALYGFSRRPMWTVAGGLVGSALIARAASNVPFTRLVGAGAGRRAVDFRKTMTIAAPRVRVYAFWSRDVDFPRYTRHVLDIRHLGEGRSRWKVLGPTGMELTWISVLTVSRPNKVIGWKTERGAAVPHTGMLRFMDAHDGGTILHLHVTYTPPGGGSVVGADVESLFEEEFNRIKTFLETERPPRDAPRAEHCRQQ